MTTEITAPITIVEYTITAPITIGSVDDGAVTANTTHRESDGKDHSDVVLNNAHRASAHAAAKSLDEHGTIADSATEDISALFTDHSMSVANGDDFTLTFSNFAEATPDVSVELVVEDSGSTVTLPGDAALFTTQTLSALAVGTYIIEVLRLTVDGSDNYAVFVGVKQ